MFTAMFWILVIWFLVNAIWMWFALDNQNLQKIFAWVNVVAVVAGFWTYYGASKVSGLSGWFMALNWLNVVLACLQFYFAYRNANKTA
ncbi:hypothetical protein [Oenococcus sicerae]|uniref:Uncharacterized protein n=1 Tax=Oenococcus sicerae TaxID=2203724 RepID=A0AAJ1VML5_9LACO|nr:hypothetical protein [Oenococcus sicerae]MDN6899781.1 hypothetical protein [Oenococcus sicerae]